MKYGEVLLNLPLEGPYTYIIPDELEESAIFGVRVVVPFGKRELTGFLIKVKDNQEEVDFELKNIKRVVDKQVVFTEDLLELAYWMKDMYLSTTGENLSLMIPSGRKESDGNASFSSPSSFVGVKELTREQDRALSILREKDEGTFYLYGVTGSGKSEVFLRRAEDMIKKGRQVLYLVPEITLSHQLSEDVLSRFDGRVAIIHSALTPSERLKACRQIMKGEVDLVIGARSAVFAPFKNLGLIILDEEHETSYKSGNTPRYHARQIAQYRAKQLSAMLIMGSATPSLEAWKLMREQKIRSIVMKDRIGEARFPKIKTINIIKEPRNISAELESAIRAALKEKKGVILFLNRRGFSYGYACGSCGHIITCPHCSVSLTYHKKLGRLYCHTCGYSEPLVRVCPECGSRDLFPRGFGTENVEEEARGLFPGARIERLDTDIADGDKAKVKAILDDFKEGKIDILLGTQMIAKGLNFPLVSLIGVLNADSMLMIPDFRAAERTFALLSQVSGRAGRYRDDGKVYIQTTQASAPAIQFAVINDLETFYDKELEERKTVFMPPYSRLINLTLRGKSESKVQEEIESLENMAITLSSSYKGIDILSSCPCIIEKKSQYYRYHIVLRSASISTLLRFTKHLLSEYKCPSTLYLEIDVDPLSLM